MSQLEACRALLSDAGRLYEKHGAGRPEPFNVFSVLRKESDEVHLHSRFLHALLCRASNLADFLRTFVPEVGNLSERSRVERERDNIDIRIRDEESRRSVVIENKIRSGDERRQLRRYACTEKAECYVPHLVFLTPDGRCASRDSAGDLEYTRLSYPELAPWLRRCQKRAFDEPALRESVAQYLRLKLISNYGKEHMDDLKKLCMERDNLLLVHDLKEALVEVKTSLLKDLWQEIIDGMKKIHGFPELTLPPCGNIIHYVLNPGEYGLLAPFGGGHASIRVQLGAGRLYSGVLCPPGEEHARLRLELQKLSGESNSRWPWFRYVPDLNLSEDRGKHFQLLASEAERQRICDWLVADVGQVWQQLKDSGLA